jgi:phosphoglycerol transferase MdoB-like AlkP superfamily enzyme
LGSLLDNKGYESRFIYGGYGYFDNMNTFFSGNRYRIIDRSSLSKDEITFANLWGVCDEDIYNRALKENDVSYTKGQPFFDMIMTTSNHQPFTYPDGKLIFHREKPGLEV